MRIPKTITALLCFLLWSASPGLRAQTEEVEEGVGIYTENLKGVFQVDAAINNPPSGDVLPKEQTDDVVITSKGYTGVGTLSPSTQLHIRSQAGVFPLRIADGSEGSSNKLLTSDSEGAASWQTPPAPPSSARYPIDRVIAKTFQRGSAAKASTENGDFVVPEDGLYSMDLRFWGESPSSANPPIQTITQFQLKRKRGNEEKIVDEFQYNEPSYQRVTVFVTLYASALQGDVLSLWIYPVKGFSSLNVTTAEYNWTHSKVLYKKLEVNDGTNYFN